MAPSRRDEDQLLVLLRDARLWAEVDSHLAARAGAVEQPAVEVTDQLGPRSTTGPGSVDPLS